LIHPAVRDLFLELGRHPSFTEAAQQLTAGRSSSLSGLTTTAKAAYIVLLWQSTQRPLFVVVDGNKEAETLSEAVQTFYRLLASDDRSAPLLLPALDVLPLQNLSPHAEVSEERAVALWRLATQRVPITVLPLASALLRVENADYYRQLALKLRIGEEVPLDELVAHLESIGYERREPVEMVGEYSVRGGILDVFSPEGGRPVRIDLFGDQVESIRRFDVDSQRSVLKVEECLLLPLTEFQRSRAIFAELGERMREADLPGRDLPPLGEAFPGWELLSGMIRERQKSPLALTNHPPWFGTSRIRSAERRSAFGPGWNRRLHPPSTTRIVFSSAGKSWRRRLPPSRSSRSSSWISPAPACIYRRAHPWRSTATCKLRSAKPATWWTAVIGWPSSPVLRVN
jgi:transcription-repair coupling factor (superfamily II helicase)